MRRLRRSLLTAVGAGLVTVMAAGVAFGQDPFAKHLEIEWLGWTMRFNDEANAAENIYLNEMSERFNTTFIWPDLRDWSNTEAVAAQLATGRIPEFSAVLQANMAGAVPGRHDPYLVVRGYPRKDAKHRPAHG